MTIMTTFWQALGANRDSLRLFVAKWCAFIVALAAFNAAQGSDLASTMFALGKGTAREANRAFAPFTKYPVAAGAVKMSVAAASGWLLIRAHRDHPKLTFWTAVGGTIAYAVIAAHNAQIGRR